MGLESVAVLPYPRRCRAFSWPRARVSKYSERFEGQEMEGAGYRLIVIHDDPGARYLIDALTLSLGIQCEAFSSAEEFLACFRPSLAGCLLTDLHLKNHERT